ncbi:MAG: hypothetical protein Mars2KO_08830 [Maribacter sp.]|uniref:DUF4199 domain-containing protein n=1 Tax=Maribacter sp. 2307UL18-2 TaxID=3386274 RepID=UPI0039BD04ED
MEENLPKTGKFAWTYGLLLGLASIIFSLMLYFAELHYEQSWSVRIIGIILTVIAIFLATSQFKKANGGLLSLSQALKLGAGIGLVGGIIALAFYWVLTNVIEPDFMEKAMAIAKVQAFADNPKLTEEQWAQGMEMQGKIAWLAYPIGIILNVVIGLIIGLFTGLILKKGKNAI